MAGIAKYPQADGVDRNWFARAACRAYDPDWWTGDHLGGHAACHHAIARHICLRHCPVLHQCRAEAKARPWLYRNSVMGGLLILAKNDNARLATHQPGTEACARTPTAACFQSAEVPA